MIGDWIAQAGTLLIAAAVIFAPGLAIGWALRLRGLALWALAPVGSVAVLAVLAMALGEIGVSWSPLIVAPAVLVIALIAFVVGRMLLPREEPAPSTGRMLLIAGLVAGGLVGALRLGFYIGDPSAISQTNDAVFHMNAVRWVLENGSASAFDVSAVIGARSFYPAAWHAVTSLVAIASGAQIAVAANMVSLVITAAVWPLGIAWLTRVAAPQLRHADALAGALSAGLLVFPILLFQWGVLFPNALSIALLPAAVAVTIRLLIQLTMARAERRPWPLLTRDAVFVLAGLGALAVAQPSSILVWVVLVYAWILGWVLRGGRAGLRAWLVPVVVLLASTALFTLLWLQLARGTSGSHWPPFRSKPQALLDVLVNGQLMLPPAYAMSVLMIVGLVVAVRARRSRWIAFAWVGLSELYAISAGIGHPGLRRWLLGPWYADPYRLGSLAALVVVPLAAIGLAWLIQLLVRRFSARLPAIEGTATAIAIGVVAAVGILTLAVTPVVHMPKVVEGEWDEQTRYASNVDAFLSPDERVLLERLDENVEPDAVIIGNPGTGTGFGYLLSGRNVYPRTWAAPRTEQWQVLADGLRDGGSEVCEALEVYGAPEYVLDFGPGEMTPGRYMMPGFTDFAGQRGFELVDAEGEASLWRITVCAQ